MTALRSEGHDVVTVGEAIDLGSDDHALLEYAAETDRVILSQDTDFRGGDPELELGGRPAVFACDTGVPPGKVAAAVRRIEEFNVTLTGTVLFVPATGSNAVSMSARSYSSRTGTPSRVSSESRRWFRYSR